MDDQPIGYPRLGQDREGVLPRLAGVYDEGEVELAGEGDLLGEDPALGVARRKVVVVVKRPHSRSQRRLSRSPESAGGGQFGRGSSVIDAVPCFASWGC